MYQMLVQDQQIKYDQQLRKQADTSLVYEAIFQEYGYDTDDFLYSLEYYLAEPAKFEKIMEKVGDRLDKEVSVVRAEVRQMQWREKLMRIYNMQPDTSRRPLPRVRPVDTLPLRYGGDSLRVVTPWDSLLHVPQDSMLFVSVRDSL